MQGDYKTLEQKYNSLLIKYQNLWNEQQVLIQENEKLRQILIEQNNSKINGNISSEQEHFLSINRKPSIARQQLTTLQYFDISRLKNLGQEKLGFDYTDNDNNEETKSSMQDQYLTKKLVEKQVAQALVQSEIIYEKMRQHLLLHPDQEVVEYLEQIMQQQQYFQEMNKLLDYESDSPDFDYKLIDNYKLLENYENLIGKWAKISNQFTDKLSDLSQLFTKLKELIKESMKICDKNKELQSQIILFDYFTQELQVLFDIVYSAVKSQIYTPLYNFYKKGFIQVKSAKHKFEKAYYEFDHNWKKLFSYQKHHITRDQKNFLQIKDSLDFSLKQLVQTRLELIYSVNGAIITFNILISEKIISTLLTTLNFATQIFEFTSNLEPFFNQFIRNLKTKFQFYDEMKDNYQKIRQNRLYFNLEDKDKSNDIFQNELISGYINIKTDQFKQFKKRYLSIKHGELIAQKYDISKHKLECLKIIGLKIASVKVIPQNDLINLFQITSPNLTKPVLLQSMSKEDTEMWVKALQHSIENCFANNSYRRRSKSLLDGISIITTNSNETRLNLVQLLTSKAKCNDCGLYSSTWVSLNLGVLLCLDCSGVHRKLGIKISKIKSLKMDQLEEFTLIMFNVLNDANPNTFWEGNSCSYSHYVHGLEFEDSEQKYERLLQKYQNKAYIKQYNKNPETFALQAIKESCIYFYNINFGDEIHIDGKSTSYIHYAAAYSDPSTLELLYNNFPEHINLIDKQGKKPLDYAKESQNEFNQKYLVFKNQNP